MRIGSCSGNELEELGPSTADGSGILIVFGFDFANGGDEGDDSVADGAAVFGGEDVEEFGLEGGFGGGVKFGEVPADAFAEDDGGDVTDGVVLGF